MRLVCKLDRICSLILALFWVCCLSLNAQQSSPGLRPEDRHHIDQVVARVLDSTGAPSASVAIVKNGQLAYVQAYGTAVLEPRKPARAEMRYSIGSVSKQFTAAAILRLSEEQKLSLDDPVIRFLPSLTRAGEISIRELLSHTSGYQDYWPQDYVPPFMLVQVTPGEILDRWAQKPLDFDPGTKWQYSNTNFVIAGLIVQKVSGMPFFEFLQQQIFRPLDMQSVANVDEKRLGENDATGYLRYALGPPRIAPKEATGWLFAAAELAMSAQDLAKWNISLMNESLLKQTSYREMEREVLLSSGQTTHYGLGMWIKSEFGHRTLEHGGDVSGFTAENMVFPDDHMSVSILVNQDVTKAAPECARRIAQVLFGAPIPARDKALQAARTTFGTLQHGSINRSDFTADANSYFTPEALNDFKQSLAPLGPPLNFVQTGEEDRGGMTFRSYQLAFPEKTLALWVREMPDGEIEQYQLMAEPKLETQ